MTTYLYEILERLVAFDTVSINSDLPAMEYLADRMDSHGLKTALHRAELARVAQANLVAWAGPPSPGGLIICGHLDTVPFAGQPGWERDPLKLQSVGDRLFGRGVSDMKGFLAQAVETVRTFDRTRLRRPVVFVFTASEEIGGLGAMTLAPELANLLGEMPRPTLAWIGEPTSFAIHAAHKSAVVVEITVHGIGGHSGAPDRGVNAIAVAGKVIEAIGQLQQERRFTPNLDFREMFPEAPYDVMNFGTITGGIAENVIAEQCRLRLSYRTLPGTDPAALRDEIARRCGTLETYDYASRNLRARIEVGAAKVMPAMSARLGTPLEAVLKRLTGAEQVSGAPFCTDGGWLALAGIASLICGPGEYAQAHQPNESIGRDAFERGPDFIRQVIEALCCDGA
jgi:acetylornithine deacetylase